MSVATPKVRVLDPWETYKEWKAGKASLPQLLTEMVENAVGIATGLFSMGWRQKAEQQKEQAERALALFKEREGYDSDEPFLEKVEKLIELYRPTLRVLPPKRHQRYGRYWTSIDLLVSDGARGIYRVQAEAEGKHPLAKDPVWVVSFVKKQTSSGDILESLSEGHTRAVAVETMKTIATERM